MKKLLLAAALTFAFASPAFAESKEGVEKSGGGKYFEKLDLNSDGMVTKEEFVESHEKRFSEMDTNADGSISQDEAKASAEKWREERRKRRAEKAAEKEMKEHKESHENSAEDMPTDKPDGGAGE